MNAGNHLVRMLCVSILFAGCSSSEKAPDSTAAMEEIPPAADAATDMIPDIAVNREPNTAPSPNASPSVVDPAPVANVEVLPPPPSVETQNQQQSQGQSEKTVDVESPAEVSTLINGTVPGSAAQQSYTVRSGDTLMKIAFENYGDLYQWKNIYELNRDVISNPNQLTSGAVLRLDAPRTRVTIDRNGEKYLIQLGDTLGTISHDVYGTPQKWRRLWDNNRQLIKDPNRIYAGFYLYYTMTAEEREEADHLKRQEPAPQILGSNTGSENRLPAQAN